MRSDTGALTEAPRGLPGTFLDFPLSLELDRLKADIAILGIPYGVPYYPHAMANEQSRAPDALRQAARNLAFTREHYDWDLGGPLFDGQDIKVVDCGNVTADCSNHGEHLRRAETAARKIFRSGATLIALGGDHGIPIPIFRALEEFGKTITLVQVDAHLDWRDEVNGETKGYSSPIRRASEMDWIGPIVQIGLRGTGSAHVTDVEDARAYGSVLIDAYEMHRIGMEAVLARIPDGGPYYLTVDADGIDPAIMPAVMAQMPGGLTWLQIRELVHGLVGKGPVLGMDVVEIAPGLDVGSMTMLTAKRLICNFIGAAIRAGYYI